MANIEDVEHSLDMLEKFNESIKAIAEHFGTGVVDLYGIIGPKVDEKFLGYMGDSLHPSPTGMEAIEECFLKVLKNE